MILSFLFFAFLAYLLFQLVFNFIIPVYKTTRKVRQTFRHMHEQMDSRQPSAESPNETQKTSSKNKKTTLGDYIEFEEVKDK